MSLFISGAMTIKMYFSGINKQLDLEDAVMERHIAFIITKFCCFMLMSTE